MCCAVQPASRSNGRGKRARSIVRVAEKNCQLQKRASYSIDGSPQESINFVFAVFYLFDSKSCILKRTDAIQHFPLAYISKCCPICRPWCHPFLPARADGSCICMESHTIHDDDHWWMVHWQCVAGILCGTTLGVAPHLYCADLFMALRDSGRLGAFVVSSESPVGTPDCMAIPAHAGSQYLDRGRRYRGLVQDSPLS